MTQQPHATQPPTGGGQQPTAGGQPQTGGGQQRTGEQTRPTWEDYGYASTPTESAWARGGVVLAGVLMLVNGILAIFQGISALAKDDVWTTLGDYVYKINLTGWGIILVVLGAVAALTGVGILMGAAWARVTGIFLASLSLIAQFLFLPYAPIWSLIMIAVNIFVIWALAVYRPAGGRPQT
ncbi:hypothetical protein [Streptomyces sp. NPDC050287]|uniref:DUF7144 family membrane protein n=1 Tax=Streptomyces sp. NPDC050287 TaxID=3365608 RepID=UPI0037910AFB